MNHSYLPFPNLNPIVFSIGKISLHWYGIMYLLGLFFALYVGKKKAKKNYEWTQEEIENLIYNSFFSLLIGGKLGYIILYNPSYYLNNINNIFKIWEGGMSFHGGFIGVIITVFFFQKKQKNLFYKLQILSLL